MKLMAEWNRLLSRHVGLSEIGRFVNLVKRAAQRRDYECGAVDTQLGERVSTAMKYLSHRSAVTSLVMAGLFCCAPE